MMRRVYRALPPDIVRLIDSLEAEVARLRSEVRALPPPDTVRLIDSLEAEVARLRSEVRGLQAMREREATESAVRAAEDAALTQTAAAAALDALGPDLDAAAHREALDADLRGREGDTVGYWSGSKRRRGTGATVTVVTTERSRAS